MKHIKEYIEFNQDEIDDIYHILDDFIEEHDMEKDIPNNISQAIRTYNKIFCFIKTLKRGQFQKQDIIAFSILSNNEIEDNLKQVDLDIDVLTKRLELM